MKPLLFTCSMLLALAGTASAWQPKETVQEPEGSYSTKETVHQSKETVQEPEANYPAKGSQQQKEANQKLKRISQRKSNRKQHFSAANLTAFENELESLRKHYHIPSISVGVVHNKELKWHKGFGYADIEKKIIPNEHTIYHLASVTKTFGAIILMQLVEQGKISLEDPVTKYNIKLGARWNNDSRIKLKHLLTHTAQGGAFNSYKPGYEFHYNGSYYAQLGEAIDSASGHSFSELLVREIIRPLKMYDTAPTVDDSLNFSITGYDRTEYYNRLAKAYDWSHDSLKSIVYPVHISPAAGIMSSVADLAKYSNAIDEGKFLKKETWETMLTPIKSLRGRTLRYGLGWFVTYRHGVKMIWHTGLWQGASALFLKVPEHDLTFIILANSMDVSRPFYHYLNPLKRNLSKNISASAFARAFFKYFLKD